MSTTGRLKNRCAARRGSRFQLLANESAHQCYMVRRCLTLPPSPASVSAIATARRSLPKGKRSSLRRTRSR
jgi:hypothetical protein